MLDDLARYERVDPLLGTFPDLTALAWDKLDDTAFARLARPIPAPPRPLAPAPRTEPPPNLPVPEPEPPAPILPQPRPAPVDAPSARPATRRRWLRS